MTTLVNALEQRDGRYGLQMTGPHELVHGEGESFIAGNALQLSGATRLWA